MKNKVNFLAKKIFVAIFAICFFALGYAFFGNNNKTIFALGDSVSVTIDGTETFYSSADDAFDFVESQTVQSQIVIKILADCQMSKTFQIDSNQTVLILSNGDFTISRAGSTAFSMFSNDGTLQIGEDGGESILTLDGSNMDKNIFENYDTLTLNNVSIQNGSSATGLVCVQDNGGAIKNYGTVDATNLTIQNFVAKNGGAIFNCTNFFANGLKISNCSATENYGSAIFNQGGRVVISSAQIHNNNCLNAVEGVIASIGSGAKMTLGGSAQNQSVNIFDNSTFGTCSAILNGGSASDGAQTTIVRAEIYDNNCFVEDSQNTGAVKNFGALTISYANIYGNTTHSFAHNVDNVVVGGAGIYNNFGASLLIVSADITRNQTKIYTDSDYLDQISQYQMTDQCHSFGAGISNFGSATINAINLDGNNAFVGADLFQKDSDATSASQLVIRGDTNPICLGNIYFDSQNPIEISNIKTQSILQINALKLGADMQSVGKTIASAQDNQTKDSIEYMISQIDVADGYCLVLQNGNVVVKASAKIEVMPIYGDIIFGESCSLFIRNFTIQGQQQNIEDYVDSIEYCWYYSDTDGGEKTQIEFYGSKYVIGSGLVGKYIYATAKFDSTQYVSQCPMFSFGQVGARTVVASWNRASFTYLKNTAQKPILLGFLKPSGVPVDVDSMGASYTLYYSYFDASTNGVTNPVNVGKYIAKVAMDSQDLILDESSATLEFSISPKVVSIPSIKTALQRSYNFKEQTIEVEYDEQCAKVSGNKATSIGKYVLKIELLDTKNYIWADKDATTAPITIEWEIISPISPWLLLSIAIVFALLVLAIIWLIWRKRKKKERLRENINVRAISEFNKNNK